MLELEVHERMYLCGTTPCTLYTVLSKNWEHLHLPPLKALPEMYPHLRLVENEQLCHGFSPKASAVANAIAYSPQSYVPD